jgi:phage shock protein A
MALDRSLTYETAAHNFSQQVDDQAHQVELLKTALHRLEQKMAETRAAAALLTARHRRAKVAERAGIAALGEIERDSAFQRMRDHVSEAEAIGEGHLIVAGDSAEKRLEDLEREDKVERLLGSLKAKTG